jgi:chorismate mutase
VAETSWFKRNIVSLLNKINGRVNVVDQIADIKAIKNINSEAELLNFIKE